MVTVTLAGTPSEVHAEAREFFQLTEVRPVEVKTPPLKEVVKKSEPKVERTEKAIDRVVDIEKAEPMKEAAKSDDEMVLEVKNAITNLQKAGVKRDDVVKFLASFGATKGTEVKPEDRSRFLAEAKAKLPKE